LDPQEAARRSVQVARARQLLADARQQGPPVDLDWHPKRIKAYPKWLEKYSDLIPIYEMLGHVNLSEAMFTQSNQGWYAVLFNLTHNWKKRRNDLSDVQRTLLATLGVPMTSTTSMQTDS